MAATRAARLANRLIEQVFKHWLDPLVPRGRAVGQVIGDGVQIGLLNIQSGFSDPQ